MSIQLSEKQLDLLERLTVVNQQHGLPPAESRVLALLLISDVTQLTFDEIQSTLKLSKGATSNAISTLTTLDKVEFHTKLGDRKRYFSSNIVSWKLSAKQGFEKMLNVLDILNEVLDQRTKDTPEFNAALEELIGFIAYLQTEMPRLFEQWENQKQKTAKE